MRCLLTKGSQCLKNQTPYCPKNISTLRSIVWPVDMIISMNHCQFCISQESIIKIVKSIIYGNIRTGVRITMVWKSLLVTGTKILIIIRNLSAFQYWMTYSGVKLKYKVLNKLLFFNQFCLKPNLIQWVINWFQRGLDDKVCSPKDYNIWSLDLNEYNPKITSTNLCIAV